MRHKTNEFLKRLQLARPEVKKSFRRVGANAAGTIHKDSLCIEFAFSSRWCICRCRIIDLARILDLFLLTGWFLFSLFLIFILIIISRFSCLLACETFYDIPFTINNDSIRVWKTNIAIHFDDGRTGEEIDTSSYCKRFFFIDNE